MSFGQTDELPRFGVAEEEDVATSAGRRDEDCYGSDADDAMLALPWRSSQRARESLKAPRSSASLASLGNAASDLSSDVSMLLRRRLADTTGKVDRVLQETRDMHSRLEAQEERFGALRVSLEGAEESIWDPDLIEDLVQADRVHVEERLEQVSAWHEECARSVASLSRRVLFLEHRLGRVITQVQSSVQMEDMRCRACDNVVGKDPGQPATREELLQVGKTLGQMQHEIEAISTAALDASEQPARNYVTQEHFEEAIDRFKLEMRAIRGINDRLEEPHHQETCSDKLADLVRAEVARERASLLLRTGESCCSEASVGLAELRSGLQNLQLEVDAARAGQEDGAREQQHVVLHACEELRTQVAQMLTANGSAEESQSDDKGDDHHEGHWEQIGILKMKLEMLGNEASSQRDTMQAFQAQLLDLRREFLQAVAEQEKTQHEELGVLKEALKQDLRPMMEDAPRLSVVVEREEEMRSCGFFRLEQDVVACQGKLESLERQAGSLAAGSVAQQQQLTEQAQVNQQQLASTASDVRRHVEVLAEQARAATYLEFEAFRKEQSEEAELARKTLATELDALPELAFQNEQTAAVIAELKNATHSLADDLHIAMSRQDDLGSKVTARASETELNLANFSRELEAMRVRNEALQANTSDSAAQVRRSLASFTDGLAEVTNRQEAECAEARTEVESIRNSLVGLAEGIATVKVNQETLDGRVHWEESEARRSVKTLTEELDRIRASQEQPFGAVGSITCFAEELSKLNARQEALGHEVSSDRESVKHFFTYMQGQSDRASEELRAQAHEILSLDRRELAESAQEAGDRAHIHMEQIAGSFSDRVRQELVDTIASLSQSIAALTEQLTHNEDCLGSALREQQSMRVELQTLNKRMAAMPREAASREELHGAVDQLRRERTIVPDAAAVGHEELLTLREAVIQKLQALPELTTRCERAAQDAAVAQGDVEGLVEDVSFMKARQELLAGEAAHLRENLQLVRQHLGDLRSETERVTEELRTELMEQQGGSTVGAELVRLPGETPKPGIAIQSGTRMTLDLELAAGQGTHKLADDHRDVLRHELGRMVVPLIDGLRQELAEVAAALARELATVAEHAHHAAADGKHGIDLLRSDLSLLREDLRNTCAQTCGEEQPPRGAPSVAQAVEVCPLKDVNGWVLQMADEDLPKMVLPPKGCCGKDSIPGCTLQQHPLSSVGRLRQRLVQQLLEAASNSGGPGDLDKLQGLPIFEATLQQPAGVKPLGRVQAEIVNMVEGEDTEDCDEGDGSCEQADDDVRAAEELFCEFFKRHSAVLEQNLASLQTEFAALVQEVAAGHVMAASGAVVARASAEETAAVRADFNSMQKEVTDQSDRNTHLCNKVLERVEQLELAAATNCFELGASAPTCSEAEVNREDMSAGSGSEGLHSRVDRLEEHFNHVLVLLRNQAEAASFGDDCDLVEY